MLDQTTLEVALQHVWAKREEVERVGVFEDLLGKLGLLCGQGSREIGEGASLPGKKLAFDLMDKNVTTPAVFNCLPRVPGALFLRFDGVEQTDVMPPWQ